MLELIIIAVVLVVAYVYSGFTKEAVVKAAPVVATGVKVSKDLGQSAYYEVKALKLDNEEINAEAEQRAKEFDVKKAYKEMLIETEKLTGTSALSKASRSRYEEALARKAARETKGGTNA